MPKIQNNACSFPAKKIAIIDGAGRLISEACRGSGTHLHSRTLNIITGKDNEFESRIISPKISLVIHDAGTVLCVSPSSVTATFASETPSGHNEHDVWTLSACRYRYKLLPKRQVLGA